jgi:DivIVA domain-containing protein
MVDEATSDEIRTHQFDVVRKGYDRTQVETFLAKVARQFDALESVVAEISNRDVSLGIDNDAEALAREMAVIGEEINTILEAARSAAEGMRTRATEHADSATSEADSRAYTAREAAWVEGSAMLEAAIDDAQTMVIEAETDALRIRAEAEREAIRYTADAKRMSEEAIGAAENEAEGILATARAESERLVRIANQSAELAQERARALEDRRSELLVELESTRSSIGDLETEFETKRQVLEEPEPAATPEYDERSHHHTDGGSVRIVSGSKVVPLRPVDADSFVAEVAELYRSKPVEASSQSEEGSPFTVDSSQFEEGSQSMEDSRQPEQPEPESSVPQLAGGDVEERDRGGSQKTESPPLTVDRSQSEEDSRTPEVPVPESSVPQLAGGDVEERDRGGSQEEIPEDRTQSTEQESVVVEAPVDSIGSLFAQLREEGPLSAEESQLTAEETELTAEETEQVTGDISQSAISRQPASAPGDTQPILDTENGERGKDNASLIPVQNAALRSIKRQLVDLQNDALEHLRVDTAWVPEEAFTDCFSEPFGELASSIANSDDDGGAAAVFATDLYDAVSSAVVASREAGSGDRAIAAATSKIFRTWRSDEAERRVVAVASELSGRT